MIITMEEDEAAPWDPEPLSKPQPSTLLSRLCRDPSSPLAAAAMKRQQGPKRP